MIAAEIQPQNNIIPLQFQPEEIEALENRDKIPMDVWAEREYMVSDKDGGAMPGPWSNYYSPFLVEPMRRLSQVGEVQVTMMTASQWGKTAMSLIFVGHTVDQDPASMQIIMPTETDTNERVSMKMRPMFEANPKLLKHLPGGRVEGLCSGRATMLDNMPLFIGWSGSPSTLADKSVCKMILDEVGKYPPQSGKESDPVSLAKKRLRTFKGRWKLLVVSTPATEDDLIHAEFKKGITHEWWVQCPHCNDWHILSWWNVAIDKNENGEFYHHDYYKDGKHSRYVCPDCAVLWTEQDRWAAASKGMWCQVNCKVVGGKIEGEIKNTTHYCFHGHAQMISPMFTTTADLVVDWVTASEAKKTGNIEPLKDFYNSQLGLPWREVQAKTAEKTVFEHKGLYHNGFVPEYVQILVNAIDVQLDHVYVMTLGVGYLWQSGIIFFDKLHTGDTKNIENWGPVEDFLKMEFPRKDNLDKKLYPAATAIDCGYNKETVINFCRKITWHRLIPIRGDDNVKGVIYRENKKDDPGIIRYDLNVNKLKDSVFELLHRSEIFGPGYMQIPQDATLEMVKQLCSEHQVYRKDGKHKQLVWEPKDVNHPQNHAWDLTGYAKWLADFLGARMLRAIDDQPKKKDKFERETQTEKPIKMRY